MAADVATTMDTSYLVGIDNFLVMWGGTNDLTLVVDPDGPTIYGRCVDYCTARKALGDKVVAFSLLLRTGLTTSKQTALDYFNAQVRANYATFATEYHDCAAISQFADPANTTYWADGLHLTDAGREINATAIKTLLGVHGVHDDLSDSGSRCRGDRGTQNPISRSFSATAGAITTWYAGVM